MPATLIIPCDRSNLCDNDNPLANLTSEAPDASVAISVFFPTVNPPLGKPFNALGCVGVCTSTISQEDADLCAARQAIQCVINPPCVPPCGVPPPPDNPVCVTPGGCPPGPPPTSNPPGCPGGFCPPPAVTFCNDPQSCCVPCPDGTLFCYTVPRCMFFADSLAAANATANSYACNQAKQTRICIIGEPDNACTGDTYHEILFIQGGTSRIYNWTLISGSLPPGIPLVNNGTPILFLNGVPTTPGVFTFTLRATDPRGNFMQKVFTISILEITSQDPPVGEVGTAYSFQFTAVGGVQPYFFTVTGGSLPDGLSLTLDGLLSGTPTTDDTSTFTVCVTDSAD